MALQEHNADMADLLVPQICATRSILALVDGITAPAAIVGVAQIYVDIADGDLKVRFGDGFIRTIALDS